LKVYKLDKPGSVDGLAIHEVDKPSPGNGEILLRVRATSINNRDLLVVRDQYGFPIPPGLVPLSDAAGEVEAIGAGVRRFKVGDRVAPAMQIGWIGGRARPEYFGTDLGGSLDGVLSQYVVVPAESAVHLPPHLSFEEAATLNCAGVTAWAALNEPYPIGPGETVLVQGSGGVALFGLQLAKAMGARVIALTSSEAKAQRLRALGADEVINYRSVPDWDQVARSLTGNQGVDRVIETGGPATIAKSLSSLRIGGQISLIGFSGGMQGASLDPVSLIGRAIRIETIAVGSRMHFEDMNRLIAAARIRPVVDRVFPFDEAAKALVYLESRRHIGKIVIAVP